ncbi:hypothetical protein D0867_09983 [Hortaea werneckii]|uniref:U-box domain-containing protein n=2 Tax=Hortaea werneckii TaxID=91943 RepID=A0A3M6YRN3_HORWE|nr:hypothetical protein D0867_09983 [Hortaea werneckii]
MADSTMSDAEKIRMRRLQKLGGPPGGNSGTSSPNQHGAGSPTQSSPTPAQSAATSPPAQKEQPSSEPQQNPFDQLGMKGEQEKKPAPQIKVRPAASSPPSAPAKRERDGAARPRSKQREPEDLESWQDRSLRSIFRVSLKAEETQDFNGNRLLFLKNAKEEMEEAGKPVRLSVEDLESAITEMASNAPGGKPFEYLLACFKRTTRALRGGRFSGPEDPKRDILKEARRLCMSYCIFAVTLPEMFENVTTTTNPLVDHLLADPECDVGICTDFLDEASARMDEDDSIGTAFMGAAEDLSRRALLVDMNGDYRNHVRGLMNLMRYPKICDAVTQSEMWAPSNIQAPEIETKTLLGPFFRLSPMQINVARNYFSAPKTRDRAFISNAQNAIRLTLRNHQTDLFEIVNSVVRHRFQGRPAPWPKDHMLDWFALCVNKNHKKRAMRVNPKEVSTDGFMLNVTTILDQLCEPFLDATFSKIDKIDPNYLRRSPRVDISDETKINADQKTADEFFSRPAEGTNGFVSECFFLTVAAHHYGTEAAQDRMGMMRKSVKRIEQDLVAFEADRHKYVNDQRYLAIFDKRVDEIKKHIDDSWSTIFATHGVLLDDISQARSMQFMRYLIVFLLRLASGQNIPREQLKLPLPSEEPDAFRCLPEYFMEDIVDNFKFITGNIPWIITPQQCEEIVQVCITFLRTTEYVKNPGVKSGLVTILFYGCQPFGNQSRGLLGDLLMGSPFAQKHLLYALMKFYIEAESTGSHTQFYDKFNIRYEIFQVIKSIWPNTMYRDSLAKEAKVNTDFFVQFVNMIVNDVTFVLDESLSSFSKIHDLSKEINSPAFSALDEEQRKEKQENLEEQKGKAKSYMQLTRESMETLILFTESLPDAFTMPEIVARLAAMLDYNLDIMVGTKRAQLRVENAEEYKFSPKDLLTDIVKVFLNLSSKQRLVDAISEDGRSYRPENFTRAADLMKAKVYMAPEEIRAWISLGDRVVAARAAREEEEEDLGEIPDEYLDPLLADLMTDPVTLPASKMTVERNVIRQQLLSDPVDPFNRAPLKIEDVIPNTELREEIEKWKAETLAKKRAEKAAAAAGGGGKAMDTTAG